MGKGLVRIVASMLAPAMLAACQPAAAPARNVAEGDTPATPAPAAAAAPAAPAASLANGAVAADAPLGEWLVGSWSFEEDCASDFIARYGADGSLDNSGEVGSWALAGDQVTETIHERFENGGDAPVKVDPPLRRSYAVARKDATHGVVTIEGRTVPMLRC